MNAVLSSQARPEQAGDVLAEVALLVQQSCGEVAAMVRMARA
ncbi:hypothetical protein ACUTR7_21365 [Delftia sp. NA_296.1]